MENTDLNTDTAEDIEDSMGDVDASGQDGGVPASIDQTPGAAPDDASGSSGSGGAFANTGG